MDWLKAVKDDFAQCSNCGRKMQNRKLSTAENNAFFWICSNCNHTKKIFCCSVEYMNQLRNILNENC